jgi:hypothetical protein
MSRSDRRYLEILRKLEQQQRQAERAPVQSRLTQVLDDVNAFGFLEDVQSKPPRGSLCFGPKVVNSGLKPTAVNEASDEWAGVVIWCKPRGYYGYRVLTLVGLWTYTVADTVYLTLGTKELPFTGPYYNAESYFRNLQTNFHIYHQDDGSPPADSGQRYTVAYDPAQRLAIRQAIQTELANWVKGAGQKGVTP